MISLLFGQILTLKISRNWITYLKSVAIYLVRPKSMPAILFQSVRVSMAYVFWLCSMEPHWFRLDLLNRQFAVNSLDLFRCIGQLRSFFPIVAPLQHSNPLLKISNHTINQCSIFLLAFVFLHSQFLLLTHDIFVFNDKNNIDIRMRSAMWFNLYWWPDNDGRVARLKA